MHLEKLLYLVVCLGSVVYFLIYGLVMKKLPIIMISYGQPAQNRDHSGISETHSSHEKARMEVNEVDGNISTTKTRIPKITADPEDEPTENMEIKINSFLFNFKSDKSSFKTDEPQTSSPQLTTSTKTAKAPMTGGLSNFMKLIDRMEKKALSNHTQECVKLKHVGPIALEIWKSESIQMAQVEKELSFVTKGGSWKPSHCQNTKVAIVVPFRDRQSHLAVFLKRIHRFLRWQLLDYKIYIIEQSFQHAFNRGILMNIGFEEAMKRQKYDCVIFHDIDLLPEDDRNDYGCPSSPRHMSTAVDTMDYKLGYKKIFGGVEGFWPDHFRTINGFPNRYWGWGGEDDDLYIRIIENSLGLTRPAQQIGRYTMIKHKKSDENPHRHRLLRESRHHIKEDGLSSLKYEITQEKEYQLYTMISVDIKPSTAKNQNSWSIFA